MRKRDTVAIFFKAPKGIAEKFDFILKGYGLKRGEVFVNLMDCYTAEDALAQVSAYCDPIQELKQDMDHHRMIIQQLEEQLGNMQRSAKRMKVPDQRTEAVRRGEAIEAVRRGEVEPAKKSRPAKAKKPKAAEARKSKKAGRPTAAKTTKEGGGEG